MFEEQKKYKFFAWGKELFEHVIDPNGLKLTNTWEYYTNSADTGKYRQLKQKIDWKGSWERYDYDVYSRVTKIVSPLLNTAPDAAESQCRVITNSYAHNGDITTVEKLLDNEISRSYQLFGANVVTNIQCQTAGASPTASDNLKTIIKNYSTAESALFSPRPKSIKDPDGTMTFYSYASNATGGITIISTNGQPNGAETAILEGTKIIRVTGLLGETISNIVINITGGTEGITTAQEITSYIANLEDFRRSGVTTYLGGEKTGKYFSLSCCSSSISTNKDGAITTNYFDALERQIASSDHFGVKTTNVLDAADQVLKVIRAGTDGTQITLQQFAYDAAKRVIKETNAVGGVTTINYGFDGDGRYCITNTYPDGGTHIEMQNKDGSVYKLIGTAVRRFCLITERKRVLPM